MKKILFISHEASRTGAPLLLLGLLKWLKHNTALQFDIFLLDGGELEGEFEKVGKVLKMEVPQLIPFGLKKQIINRIFRRQIIDLSAVYYNNFFNTIKNENYSVIYGNTIVSITILEKIYSLLPHAAYILHVHELYSITVMYSNIIKCLKHIPIKYITVSEITHKNLIEQHGVESDILYEFIDTSLVEPFYSDKSSNNFVINGSGFVQPRKGYDIFIAIAKRAVQKYNNIPFYFRWIGKIPAYLKPYIDSDIKNADLDAFIEFTDELIVPYSEYAKADVFLLTSREDPFPIVSLEHACLGKPIICFEKASGIPEFIGNNAGIVVPYLDIEKVVDTLAYLYHNPEILKELGLNARQKVKDYDINHQALKILQIIENA